MPGNVPPVADERSGLLAFLQQQREGMIYASYGLTDEQMRSAPSVSALSIGGLLKHVASTERGWIDVMLQRESEGGGEEQYGDNFRVAGSDTLADLVAQYRAVAAETEAAVAGVDLDAPVPVPDAPWFPKDVTNWSVRWVLLHLIEETARHAGHADIVRESIDGATVWELMAAAEDWPDEPWITKWQPRATGEEVPPEGG